MARVKAEMKCPYCDAVKAVSGMTSHVRAKHTEHYEEFKNNRLALVEKYKIVEGKPTPVSAETAPPDPDEPPLSAPEPATETPTEPDKTPAPAPKEQQTGSFLGSVGKALRDW